MMPASSILLPAVLTAALAVAGPSTTPAPAAPEPTIDSILDGLDQGPATTDDEDEAPPPAPPAAQPFGVRPPPQPRQTTEQYDETIRARARASQGLLGPMDGGWTLSSPDGQPLYRFQFVDRGIGLSLAEAAWRDLRGSSGAAGSGVVALLSYDGAQLMLRFYQADAQDLVVVSLKPAGDGWSGEMWRRGATEQVVLKRD